MTWIKEPHPQGKWPSALKCVFTNAIPFHVECFAMARKRFTRKRRTLPFSWGERLMRKREQPPGNPARKSPPILREQVEISFRTQKDTDFRGKFACLIPYTSAMLSDTSLRGVGEQIRFEACWEGFIRLDHPSKNKLASFKPKKGQPAGNLFICSEAGSLF